MTCFEDLIFKIRELQKTSKQVNISIDGSAAAGKSTLAARFLEYFDANVFHCDDYFLKNNAKRGDFNLDFLRMKEEIFDKISKREYPFVYYPFDCHTQKLKSCVEVFEKQINIFEGVYIGCPYFEFDFQLKIFMEIDEKTQKERIKLRNPDNFSRFFDEFIPKEKAYFEKYQIKEKCDIKISSEI